MVLHFGFALIGYNRIFVSMIDKVGEILTGNKKPLIYRGAYCLACPPKVVPSVKLVVVQTARKREYDT